MRALRVLLVGLVAAAALGDVGPAGAQESPRIQPAATEGIPGAKVFVDLTGWAPFATVTLTVCGNLAQRGSQDCDQIGAQSIEIRDPKGERELLTIAAPPMPCPCVIRANDLNSGVVVSAPFTVTSHPTGPLVAADPAHAPPPVRVTAVVRSERGNVIDGVRRSLGGTATRHLQLHVENVSGQALSDVVVSATLGRSEGRGAVLHAPGAFDLEAGGARDLTLPVDVSSPVWGTYHVSGAVFANGIRVAFDDTTSNVPWLLLVLAVAVVVDVIALILVTTARRRAVAEERAGDGDRAVGGGSGTPWEPHGEPAVTPSPTVGELALGSSFGLLGDP